METVDGYISLHGRTSGMFLCHAKSQARMGWSMECFLHAVRTFELGCLRLLGVFVFAAFPAYPGGTYIRYIVYTHFEAGTILYHPQPLFYTTHRRVDDHNNNSSRNSTNSHTFFSVS